MEPNIQACESYNIKSGEIFLAPTGNITIHCTLCETKYNDFIDYTNHVGAEHLPILNVEFLSDSDPSKDFQEDTSSLNLFQNNENHQSNEFEVETTLIQEDSSCEEVCYGIDVADVNKSVSRTVRRRTQQVNDGFYKCTVCDFACKLYKNLVGHLKRHSEHKPHQCTECEKAFYTRFELKTHLRSHTGERPFLCNECGQSFITSGKLADHMKRHANEKNYQCKICNRMFFNTQNLRKHLLVHSNERCYECNICNASFKRLTALSNHRKLHENKKEYHCEMCPARFNQRPGLYSHLKSKHSISQAPTTAMSIEEPIEVVL